jgi:hypothetical protein
MMHVGSPVVALWLGKHHVGFVKNRQTFARLPAAFNSHRAFTWLR